MQKLREILGQNSLSNSDLFFLSKFGLKSLSPIILSPKNYEVVKYAKKNWISLFLVKLQLVRSCSTRSFSLCCCAERCQHSGPDTALLIQMPPCKARPGWPPGT